MREIMFFNETYYHHFAIVIVEPSNTIQSHLIQGEEFNGYAMCALKPDKTILIVLSSEATAGTLVHECVHAIDFLWNECGIKRHTTADESYAYAVQWLFDKCYEQVKGLLKSK